MNGIVFRKLFGNDIDIMYGCERPSNPDIIFVLLSALVFVLISALVFVLISAHVFVLISERFPPPPLFQMASFPG